MGKGVLLLDLWQKLYGAIDWESPAATVDGRLKAFVNFAFRQKAPFYVARAAVLASQLRLPHLRFQLQGTWHALAGWSQTLEWRPRVLFPRVVVEVMFLTGVNLGMEASSGVQSRRWVSTGALLLLGFFALLRPGEFIRLRVRDLAFGTDPSGNNTMIVAIAAPKTRKVVGAGRNQAVLVNENNVVLWWRYLVIGLGPEVPLWSGSPQLFRQYFDRLLKVCGLARSGFTPASCRAGGATDMFMAGVSMEILAFKGRWLALASLRSYLQEAAAQLVWSQLPQAVQARCRHTVTTFATVLASPPSSFACWPGQWKRTLRPRHTMLHAQRPPCSSVL